jgi:hypothetical protein
MPRGRPKKAAAKPTTVEILPPEDNQPQVREIKHTTQWIETQPVEEVGEQTELEFDDESEDRPQRTRKNRNAREELRKKLRAQGVAPSSALRLYIDKYLHSDSNAGGSWAETEFCTKYDTTEEHILNKDYIDVARRWGAGKYRITIRMQAKIVDAFDERISATPTGTVIQSSNPADPSSPQVIYQTVEGQQAGTMPTLKDFMKAQREALKEQLEMAKLMREAYGLTPEAPATPKNEEEILAGAILKQPEVIENVVGSVLKRFGGKAGESSSDPWAEVAMEMVKTGQAAQVVKTVIDGLFNGFQSFIPQRGANNGQAQMGQTPMAQVDAQQPQHTQAGMAVLPHTEGQTHPTAIQEGMGANQGPQEQRGVTPEEQALSLLIDHCRQNIPARIAFSRLCNYADYLNDNAPHLSIDEYITMLSGAPTDSVIEYVKSLPGGEQIAALPHAKEWTAELQRLIKESQEGEE